jgi:3-phosphoshikimate 1-carboxyvinyltransferase
MKEIKPRSNIHATVSIPGSKSITHRAVIAASLASGRSVLENYLECEDTIHTFDALRNLGIAIETVANSLIIEGSGGKFQIVPDRKEIYMGNSGTSFRLLLSVITLGRGEYLLTGTPRMLKRPVGALVNALNQLGVHASCIEREGYPPVHVKARGLPGGKAVLDGSESSQFVSSVLLSGPHAEKEVEVEVQGTLVSWPYVDITIDVMERFGVQVYREDYGYFRVPSGQTYQSRQFNIQGDASSASYFWAVAAVTGGTVTTENIYPFKTHQGDIRFLEILEGMGCLIDKQSNRVTVQGRELLGIEADMGSMPDMVPTLAAIALFAKGKTVIRNVPHLRYKESDRLRSVSTEWRRLGAQIEERGDGLIILEATDLSGTVVDPHNDHRLAMALAVVGIRVPRIAIRNEICVNKSFPNFWKLWDKL